MQVQVLGPVRVVVDDEPVALGGPRQQTVLAVLAAFVNEVVSTDRLIDEIWGEEPPQAARNSLQSMISNLRRAVPEAGLIIEREGPGYVLRLPEGGFDAAVFAGRVEQARSRLESDSVGAAEALRQALAGWRGKPYAGVADESPALRAEVVKLEELRLRAVEFRVEADLATGRHAEVIGELEGLVAEHPLREGFYRLLMLALYRAGRQAEALRVFTRLRRTLGEELGIDPSPVLAALELAMLDQDDTLAAPVEAAPAAAPGGVETAVPAVRGYELRDRVGAGATGTVYRGYQPSLGREVAVKVIDPDVANDPEFIRRFDTEAQRIARLEHPHIVPLYDFWREPDAAYLVSRWFGVGTLSQAMGRGSWDVEPVRRLMDQIGSALRFAHRRGVGHGNLTPDNILLDDEGNAYLTDFAIPVHPDVSPRNDVAALAGVVAGLLGDVAAPPAREALAARHDTVEELLAAFDRSIGAEPAEAPIEVENPFRGLAAFQEADAGRFFGRTVMVEAILERLRETTDSSRFLAVVGASGSGKSSIVRAGVIPAVRTGALPGSESWFVIPMTPGDAPFHELEASLLRIAVNPPPTLLDQLRRDDHGIRDAVNRVLPPDGSELLLVVDQFEELFTLTEPADAGRFIDALVAAVTSPSSRVRVIVTLRADFYDRPLTNRNLAQLLPARMETVVPMTLVELEAAITEPAAGAGVTVEPGLIAAAVADTLSQPGALPLLQYTLTELFERRIGNQLTLDGYQQLGGVEGAVASRAEEIHATLSPSEQAAASQLFTRLVTLGEGAEDTRRRALLSEFGRLDTATDTRRLIDSYGAARLLSFDRDPTNRSPTVEVAHEALLREWPRLRRWVDESRDDIRIHRRLQVAAAEWDTNQRADGYLLRRGRLRTFEAWHATTTIQPGALENELLQTSLDAEAAEERRRRQRRRRIITGMAAATLVAVVLAIVAVIRSVQADRSAQLAENRELAATAIDLIDTDPELAVLLAIEAVQRDPIPEAQEALHRSIAANRLVLQLPATGLAATFLDDKRIAILNDDGTISIYDAANADLLRTLREPGWLAPSGSDAPCSTRLVSGGGGAILALATSDGVVTLIDVALDSVVWTEDFGACTSSVAFNPAASLVAARGFSSIEDSEGLVELTGAGKGGVYDVRSGRRLWEIEECVCPPDVAVMGFGTQEALWFVVRGGTSLGLTGGVPRLVELATGQPIEINLSPAGAFPVASGGRIVARPSDDRRLVYASVFGSPEPQTIYAQHTGPISALDVDGAGRRVASASTDGSAHVWTGRDGTKLAVVGGHGGTVLEVQFDPGGHRLLTVGREGTARVWDVTIGATAEILIGELPSRGEESVFIPGTSLVLVNTSSDDFSLGGALTAFDIESGEAMNWSSLGSAAIAVSPSGESVARATPRGEVIVFAPSDRDSERRLDVADAVSVAFDRRTGRLAVSQRDGSRILIDLATGDRKTLQVGDGPGPVAFTEDGRLVTGTGTRALVWNEGEAAVVVDIDLGPGVAAGATGHGLLITGYDDGAWRAWSDADGTVVFDDVIGHPGGITSVAVSPLEPVVATTGNDGWTRLWDLESSEEIVTLPRAESGQLSVAFDPTGTRIATVGLDARLRVYAVPIEELIEIATSKMTRGLTDAECRRHLRQDRCS